MNLEKSEELKAISKEDIDMMKKRGMVDGFLDRVVESKTSIAVKYVVNFVFALIQFLNVPGFISVLLAAINPILEAFDQEAVISPTVIKISFIFFIGFIICRQLHQMTITNLVSKEVRLIWFINFVKTKTKNHFYSVSTAEKHYKSLESFIDKQTEHYLKRQLKDLAEASRNLKQKLKSIDQLENFPNGTFASFQRLLSRIGNFVDYKYPINGAFDSRNNLDNILDDILIELCTLNVFQNTASSACILIGANQHYEPIGQYRYPAEAINKKQNTFPEHVIQQDEFLYYPDISKEKTMEDFFANIKDSPYTSVIGYPVKLNLPAIFDYPSWTHKKHAVICIFLNSRRDFHKVELGAIVKTMDVYANFIELALRIHLHNLSIKK